MLIFVGFFFLFLPPFLPLFLFPHILPLFLHVKTEAPRDGQASGGYRTFWGVNAAVGEMRRDEGDLGTVSFVLLASQHASSHLYNDDCDSGEESRRKREMEGGFRERGGERQRGGGREDRKSVV